MSDHFLGLNFIIRGLFVSKSVYEFRVNFISSVTILKIQDLKGNARLSGYYQLTLGRIFELFSILLV